MLPIYDRGDVIIAKEKKVYEVDDIISISLSPDEKETITHRIVEKEGNSYITKGENNDLRDPFLVKDTMILGKVERSLKGVGNILLFGRTVLGIILLLIIPATVVLTMHLKGWWDWLEEKYIAIRQ